MRLISLKIEELYDTLNLDLNFHEELNLLVGINGSGKTSALSVIDWLLTPNYAKLATQTYKRLALSIEKDGQKFDISAENDGDVALVKVETDTDTFHPIAIPVERLDRRFEMEDAYRGLSPDEEEVKAWDFLDNLRKPTVVSLERTITAEVEKEVYYERPRPPHKRNRRTTPLEHVQEIFGQHYADYRGQVGENDTRLKSQIILTALHSPDADQPTLPSFQFPQESTEQLEAKVLNYLSSSFPSEDVSNHVPRFFSYFRSLSDEIEQSSEKSGKVVDLIQSQFSRVDNLARAFKEFEERNAEAFSHLKAYLDAVNKFLKDSNKLVYADSRGRLVFAELKNGMPIGSSRPISKMSSGETQIIILFALMAFESAENSVFIVDEPELSLHPKWQTEFMESFLRLCPSNSQVLVATHSPEIAAGRKTSCVFF
ncbi:cytochrome c biogenesis protein CcmA [Phaeobacter piscinae]|uniref:Cytochrome c biogenesis protein CcmA n=1 Tax=Phaeobacter piscinae TaxID=1580596 RepID=A0AAN1GP49_9RHOB|nr:AAA family ATPase [Phaeobacter piscinae]ATG42384.1 cytochrome c biogenesis protein CcmA [Phaeobacter piscinae]AUR34718.1 cytochrome c biogenesis protein CcmA [Phaeobacter piscinae]